jgi:hypothetical protein
MDRLSRSVLTVFLSLLIPGFIACDVTGLDEGDAGVNEGAPPTASVTIAWDAPTTNADGTPLTDLQGYRIHFGTVTPLTLDNSTSVDAGNDTEYTVTGLEAGTYYFAVRAVDSNGNASSFSDEVSAEVNPQ